MMDKDLLRQRVEGFAQWHYRFDLGGVETPIANPAWEKRIAWRKKTFFDPLLKMCGGSLAGLRVLDLGCNAGFWSLQAINAGCEDIVGIDARQMHVDQANLVFEALDIDKGRYEFVKSNLYEIDFRKFGEFDIVLCLGLYYHIAKPFELMEKIAACNTGVLVIDTTVEQNRSAVFAVSYESKDDPRNAADYEMVLRPSPKAMMELTKFFGYESVDLSKKGGRRAFICVKPGAFDLSKI